jgi:hypothetical protein
MKKKFNDQRWSAHCFALILAEKCYQRDKQCQHSGEKKFAPLHVFPTYGGAFYYPMKTQNP